MSQDELAADHAIRADIGLVSALPLELAEFLSRCERVKTYTGGDFVFRGGLYDGIRVAIVESGTGQKRAARATRALLEAHKPRWIISTGFAGALVPSIQVGHMVVANRVCKTEGEELSINVGMDSDEARRLHVGKLLTVDHMVRTIDEKQSLAAQTDAIAVDMESFAVATVCRELGKHFMAIRAISDDLNADLPPEALSLIGETGAVRMGALVGSLFKRPSCVKDLWRLREQAATAADRLADFLDGVIRQLQSRSSTSP